MFEMFIADGLWLSRFMRLYTYQLASLVKNWCHLWNRVLRRFATDFQAWFLIFPDFLGEDILKWLDEGTSCRKQEAPHLDGSRKSLVETWFPVQTNNYWLVVWNMSYDFPYIGISSSQLTFIFFRGVGIPPTRLYRWHQSIHSLVVARVTFETQLFRHDLRYVVTGIVVQHKLHLVPVKTWCTCCSFVNLGSLDTGTVTHHLDQPTWSYAGVDRYALDNPNPNWLIFFRWVGIPPTSDVFLIVRTSKISLFEAWSARRTGWGGSGS